MGTSEILLPIQKDNSVPHEETQLMAPVDSFSREDTRKPEAQLEDRNVSRIEFLVAVYLGLISGQLLIVTSPYSPQRAERVGPEELHSFLLPPGPRS